MKFNTVYVLLDMKNRIMPHYSNVFWQPERVVYRVRLYNKIYNYFYVLTTVMKFKSNRIHTVYYIILLHDYKIYSDLGLFGKFFYTLFNIRLY